jgi:hypothetical protein
VSLPSDPKERKNMPIARGVLDYFPDAVAAVADVSRRGNDQHNPGQPLHWAKEKSTDHADCIARHLIERGTADTDGSRHSAKLAWRALALLQTEIENDALDGIPARIPPKPEDPVLLAERKNEAVREARTLINVDGEWRRPSMKPGGVYPVARLSELGLELAPGVILVDGIPVNVRKIV